MHNVVLQGLTYIPVMRDAPWRQTIGTSNSRDYESEQASKFLHVFYFHASFDSCSISSEMFDRFVAGPLISREYLTIPQPAALPQRSISY